VVVNGVEESVVVANTARMQGVNEWGKERYVSRTFEGYLLWKRVFGNGKGEGNGCAEEPSGNGRVEASSNKY
jgi:hypothetical protein